MNKILFLIKKIIPKKLFVILQPGYHLVLNFMAVLWYRFPSNKLTVVGITGTTGKTTVTYMTVELLKKAGFKVGYTSTAMFSDGEKKWLNDKKMTMLGRFFTQKMLREMVKNKCDVAVVETTSEGIVQYRHRFINYDILLFTGLYPEHIDSHGSFENYKEAKLKLFEHLKKCSKKDLRFKIYDLREDKEGEGEQGLAFRARRSERKARFLASETKSGFIQKTIIVNLDDEYAEEFLEVGSGVNRKMGFTNKEKQNIKIPSVSLQKGGGQQIEKIEYKFLEMNKIGTKFIFDGTEVQLNILGSFNALNATAAGCVGRALGVSNKVIKKGLESIANNPGRLERIDEGQDFIVIIDYAFEPVSVTKLYETISVLEPAKVIHVLGSTGGGRDISRRAKLGGIAGEKADYVIVTNEDPYDDDPMEIIKDVANGAKKAGKKKSKNLWLIEDRRKGIKKAISLAGEGDVVLITGKGSEQAIAIKKGELMPWDDREIVRDFLTN